MKILFHTLLAISSLALSVSADSLPGEAKREIEKLENNIKKAEHETEKKIIRKKEDTIRTLERIEKKIDNEFAKNLIKIQLIKYRKEIKESEAKFGKDDNKKKEKKNEAVDDQAKDAEKVIDFGASYFYSHPVDKFKGEIGELKFYANGKVNCYHRKGSTVQMFKKWDWSMKEGQLVITADGFHGPIYVSKKSPREIYLDWKGLVNKKNVAKQK